ncbi:MAG: VWA domain-containing protein [Acidobacteria bacterium]|nr:VWA domain-containing protein [Acidobacteriota bacterium]
MQNAITDLRAGRTTALYDAVARGLQQVRKGKHQKKVLVVVTDGEDNASETSFRRLVDLVEEERDVLVYTVGMFESLMSSWL